MENELSDTERMPAARGEVALYRAVIARAMEDALMVRATSAMKPNDVRLARAWFGSKDFYTICDLAMVDPSAVLKSYRKKLALKEGKKDE